MNLYIVYHTVSGDEPEIISYEKFKINIFPPTHLVKYGLTDNWTGVVHPENRFNYYTIFDLDFAFNRSSNIHLNIFQFKILDKLIANIAYDERCEKLKLLVESIS